MASLHVLDKPHFAVISQQNPLSCERMLKGDTGICGCDERLISAQQRQGGLRLAEAMSDQRKADSELDLVLVSDLDRQCTIPVTKAGLGCCDELSVPGC